MTRRAMVLLAAATLLWSAASPGADLHVSPAGNDGNPGTRDQPFKTFAAAQKAARALKAKAGGPVAVLFHGGTYYLPETAERHRPGQDHA